MSLEEMIGTEEKDNNVVGNLTSLLQHPGWIFVEEVVKYNIGVLQDQIVNGVAEETKEAIDRRRDKLKAYKEIINTPKFYIEKLTPSEAKKQSLDPYE